MRNQMRKLHLPLLAQFVTINDKLSTSHGAIRCANMRSMLRQSRLEVLRRWKLTSQVALAEKVGVSRRTVQYWERNPDLLGRVSAEILDRLAAALSPLPTGEPVTVDHLRGRTPIPGYTPPELQTLNELIISGQVWLSDYDGQLRICPPSDRPFTPWVADWVATHGNEALRQWQVAVKSTGRKRA